MAKSNYESLCMNIGCSYISISYRLLNDLVADMLAANVALDEHALSAFVLNHALGILSVFCI